MQLHFCWLFAICLLVGCKQNVAENPLNAHWQEIWGRDNATSLKRMPIYRAKVPASWQRKDPDMSDSIFDSTKPLCEFLILEGTEQIKITIHNFPTDSIEERVPPSAQIARWKQQFESLEPSSVFVIPHAHGGFAGLLFEGSGFFHGEQTTVIGFSMQLAPAHYRNLLPFTFSDEEDTLKQMRADYTIKAVGPMALMARHKPSILAFARSFEIIQEIPSRL